jgi:hypothetical protein
MRTYLEDTSLPVDVDELISDLTDTGHTVLLPFELAPIRRTRPALVVVVVSLLTLLVIGAFGITGLLGSDDPDVIDAPPTVVTQQPIPSSTLPQTTTQPPQSTTLRWMVATPDGGLAIGWSGRIERFDGDQWVTETEGIPRMAAVVTYNGIPRILGYGGSNLVDIQFTDGAFSVKSASRGGSGGSGPSNITVSDTVDVDSEGNAWYGNAEGAWRFDGDSLELFRFGVRGDCGCSPLAVDAQDNVWIHIHSHGDLYRLSPDGEQTRYTPEDGIPFLHDGEGLNIMATSDGSVWVISGGGGVARFDGVAWTSYTVDQAQAAGIPATGGWSSFAVVDGPDGSTWTVRLQAQGTAPVLHRFSDGQWEAVPTTGISWGRVGGDYGTLGMAVGPDGSLWIPTRTGVARFQPDGD